LSRAVQLIVILLIVFVPNVAAPNILGHLINTLYFPARKVGQFFYFFIFYKILSLKVFILLHYLMQPHKGLYLLLSNFDARLHYFPKIKFDTGETR
jgi:hypothetical protein